MMADLVLSIFPGIGLLDMAFELEGYCVVRGPDVLWGGDVRVFHPPAGVFAGVIGGPPCQMFSSLAAVVRHNGHQPRFGNLIPEFERCIAEAQPAWFVMENVPGAPVPAVDGYIVCSQIVNNRWFVGEAEIGAEQQRKRRISFGTRDGRALVWDVAALEAPLECGRRPPPAVKADNRRTRDRPKLRGNGKPNIYSLENACELQGLPRDFTAAMPFRKEAKLQAVANGVPIPMGRAIARAVKRAMES